MNEQDIQREFENFEAAMEGHETAYSFFEAGAKAALEYARKQEPFTWAVEWWDEDGEYEVEYNHVNEFSCGRKGGFPLYRHPAPSVAHEPVHFRAVLCREQQDQAIGVVPKVVGFVDKKAAEQFILEKRDFQGWRYNLEPLFAEAPPAAEVNAQLLEALKVAKDILFYDGYDIDDGGEHFSEYVQITEAIAAAEAQQGKGE